MTRDEAKAIVCQIDNANMSEAIDLVLGVERKAAERCVEIADGLAESVAPCDPYKAIKFVSLRIAAVFGLEVK